MSKNKNIDEPVYYGRLMVSLGIDKAIIRTEGMIFDDHHIMKNRIELNHVCYILDKEFYDKLVLMYQITPNIVFTIPDKSLLLLTIEVYNNTNNNRKKQYELIDRLIKDK